MAVVAERLRLAVLSGAVGLVVLLVAWRLRRAIEGGWVGELVLIVALTLPVCIALPRLRAGHRRTYAWMTLVIVPYLVVAITEAVANPAARLWAATCLFLAFGLFVLLIAYLRATRT